MQWSTFIEDDNTYTVQPEPGVTALEVYNDGPDTVYYGRVIPAATFTMVTENGSFVITVSNPTAELRQGMSVSGTGLSSNSKILSVNGNSVTLDQACTADGTDVAGTASFPLDDLTGQPLAANARVSFTAERFARFLDAGVSFFVAAAQQATLRFLKFKA